MPDRRPRTLVVSTILSLILLGGAAVPSAAASSPPGLDHFLQALAHVESGGRYNARNHWSGAYGKYQVMPSTWRVWARAYLGSSRARPTPQNQERLVRAVITSAYWRFGRWDVVAYWWLNGRARRDPARWDRASRHYVEKVMRWYRAYGGAPTLAPASIPAPSPSPSPSASDAPSPSPAPPSPAPTDAPSPSPSASA